MGWTSLELVNGWPDPSSLLLSWGEETATSQPMPGDASHGLERVDCVSKIQCLKSEALEWQRLQLWYLVKSEGGRWHVAMPEFSRSFSCYHITMAHIGGWPGPPSQTQVRLMEGQPTQANRDTSAHAQPELSCGVQRAVKAVLGELARNKSPLCIV